MQRARLEKGARFILPCLINRVDLLLAASRLKLNLPYS